jgi:DNA-binding response OmpR family regulator
VKDDKSPYVRIAELEEENRQLRALLKPQLKRPAKWGLDNMEFQVLRAIIAGEGLPVSPERIRRAVWGRDVRSEHVLRQHIYYLRKKMAPHGVSIVLQRPTGYWIDAAGLRIVREAAT